MLNIASSALVHLLDISCANPGNPVFTCDKRTVDKAKVYTFDPKGNPRYDIPATIFFHNRKKRDILPSSTSNVLYYFRNLWVRILH